MSQASVAGMSPPSKCKVKRPTRKRVNTTKLTLEIQKVWEKSNKVFPFEELPAELREMIYKEMLYRGRVRISYPYIPAYHVNGHHDQGGSKNAVKGFAIKRKRVRGRDTDCNTSYLTNAGAAILRVNRQVHNEALPVLYSWNKFEVTTIKALRPWLKQIGPATEHLHDITINSKDRTGFRRTMRALRVCTSLRSLAFAVFCYDDDLIKRLEEYVGDKDFDPKHKARLDAISFFTNGSWTANGTKSGSFSSSHTPVALQRLLIETAASAW